MQPEKAITEDMLIKLGIVKKNSNGVKLLGNGELKSKVNITVGASSKSAEQAIKKLGGSLIVQPKLKKTVQPKSAEKEDAATRRVKHYMVEPGEATL